MNELEKKVDALSDEIERIKLRNKRVEVDKAWEVSHTRTFFNAASTYILLLIVLYILHVEQPYLAAIVPTLGYILSRISYDVVKDWWLKRKQ